MAAAIAIGLTAVLPWPNVAAASSVGVAPSETLPVNASMPMFQSPPMPSALDAFFSPSAPSFGASPTNAVLQDFAKSTWKGTLPSTSPAEFLNVRPATVAVFGHSTVVSAVTAPDCNNP